MNALWWSRCRSCDAVIHGPGSEALPCPCGEVHFRGDVVGLADTAPGRAWVCRRCLAPELDTDVPAPRVGRDRGSPVVSPYPRPRRDPATTPRPPRSRARRVKPPRPGDQLEVDQRCVQCRAGAHRACPSPTCPCAENGHGAEPNPTIEENS